jgi:thiol-disulfide isomerase/thioredoxin/sugar lactone lactonase YvrE
LAAEQNWLNTSRPLTEADLRGRVLLLDFWTFCCINCQHIIPDLQKLEAEFGDRLLVIGVHSAKFRNEQDSAAIRDAMLRYGVHHPVVNDADFRLWKGLGAHGWPTLMLIDPNGRMVKDWSGEGHYDQARAAIAQLLDAYAGKALNQTPLPIALEQDKVQAASQSALSYPSKLAYLPDYQGQPALVISDSGHHRILLTDLQGKILLTIGQGQAGFADGDFASARFNQPQGVLPEVGKAGDKSGGAKIYVADTANHRLRLIDLNTGQVSTLAGTGERGGILGRESPAAGNPMASPWDLAWYPDAHSSAIAPDAHSIAIAMAGTHQLWRYDTLRQTVAPLAGNGRESIDDGRFPASSLSQPSGLSAVGDTLYFVDSETSSLRQLKDGVVTTLIGEGLFEFGLVDGTSAKARMQHPLGLTATTEGVYIADSYNHALRFYDFTSKTLRTLVGDGTAGGAANRLNEPSGLLLLNNQLWVADTNNQAIRRFDLTTKNFEDWSVVDKAEDKAADKVVQEGGLPNLLRQQWPVLQGGVPIKLAFQLPGGWELNAQAPNWLQLDDLDANQAVAALDAKQLLSAAPQLPPLLPGHRYQLSGSLYYCPHGADSTTCLLASVQEPLTVGAGGGGGGDGLTVVLPK